tara:strand:- start:967 stop:1374 length:408 start_codon:yes stop_codon:yes gene_type:complete
MFRIGKYKVRTNLDKNLRAPKFTPSSQDWGIAMTHDKYRGRVIASARVLYAPLLKVFPTSCIPTGSGRKVVNHHIKFAKYLLARMNPLKRYLRFVDHNLNVTASHIHAIPMLPGFITHQYEHCGEKNKNAFRQLG